MSLTKQIADIIRAELRVDNSADTIESTAAKIEALLPDYNAILVSSAALENEITSHLMDMLAATLLATLIEEEGGGRSNISYSPLSMDHMMKHYDFTVENDGLIRTVRISLKPDSDLTDESKWREPSNRHGVMHQDEDPTGAKPQAEEHVHNRPIWAIRANDALWRMADQADAGRLLPNYLQGDPTAHIENRFCLHKECPSTGCNEVTSDTNGA